MTVRLLSTALFLTAALLLTGCGDDTPLAPSSMDDLRTIFTAEEAEIEGDVDEAVVRLIGLQFTSSTSVTVSDDSRDILAKFAQVYELFPDHDYTVEAHTDSRGSSAYNLQFSTTRAQAVLEQLMEAAGRPTGGSMGAEGFGEERPIDNNATANGRARNRRVEVVLRKPQ